MEELTFSFPFRSATSGHVVDGSVRFISTVMTLLERNSTQIVYNMAKQCNSIMGREGLDLLRYH